MDRAIAETFHSNLTPPEQQTLKEFRDLRDSLLHADFVVLLSSLKISPTGRQILSINGDRNILSSEDIEEAIKSLDRNNGLAIIHTKANQANVILDNILRVVST